MLRAKIICRKCLWEGFPDERADWTDYDPPNHVSKETICPQCYSLYFDAPAYKEEMKRIASKHSFGFLFNPGGGAFTSMEHGNCQIGTNDDATDYKKFFTFLQSKGLE